MLRDSWDQLVLFPDFNLPPGKKGSGHNRIFCSVLWCLEYGMANHNEA